MDVAKLNTGSNQQDF